MSITDNLNPAQKKAVTFGEGPLLIVAGAGTGKTTVITERIAWLILEKKIETDHLLALTFTEKAAAEMEERIDVLLPMGYVDLWVSTFHAFCERVLKDNALEIGLPPDFKLLSVTDQVLLIQKNFDKFDLDYYRPLGNPTKFVQALVRHFSRAKDENILPDEYIEFADKLKPVKGQDDGDEEISEDKRVQEVANAYKVYQQLLLENSAMDFGDLILYTIKLFKTRPKILKKYQEQFKYILVDEFQDTNYAQYELIKLLSAPKNNLTVVGDDDQSVYKFRGAAISNILEFKKDFPESDEIVLTDNYRTKQNILDLSYKFIKQNDPNRLEYQLSKGKIDPKGAPLKNKISKKLKSATGKDGVIQHLHFNSYLDEASGVTKKILELKKKNKKLLWSDFAILIRANSYASEFINSLSRHDIPHQFLASKGLYGQPEIMDIVAYMKMLDNYHESAAMWRVLNFKQFKLPVDYLMTISRYAAMKRMSLFEAMRQVRAIPGISSSGHHVIEKILGMIEKHTQLTKERNVLSVALRFMKDSGYFKEITTKDSPENMERIIHLNQFFRKIEDFEAVNDDKSVKNFLHEFEQSQDAGESGAMHQMYEDGPEAVKIMTIHGAKGLEFKYVFIVNLVDKRFPTIERKEPIALPDELVKEIIPEGDIHLQEERRLFYVAMTRAKEGLYFTSADDYGGSRKKKSSRFLIETGFEVKKGTGEIDKTERLKATEEVKQEKIKELDYLRKVIPEKSSYTQLRAFKNCPKQFKYAHLLRIPVEGKHMFSYGKTIHNTLFKFFKLVQDRSAKGQVKIGFDELMGLYEQEWIEDWYLSVQHKEEYYEQGRESMKMYYDSLANDFPVPLFLEQPFHLKLGQHTFKGVIDRVDPVGDSKDEVEIIDYKTGKVPKNGKLSVDEKEQLMIYALAAKDILKLKPVTLTYLYVNANEPISFTATDEELEKLKDKLVDKILEIRKSDFKANPGFWCKTCDFAEICEDKWQG